SSFEKEIFVVNLGGWVGAIEQEEQRDRDVLSLRRAAVQAIGLGAELLGFGRDGGLDLAEPALILRRRLVGIVAVVPVAVGPVGLHLHQQPDDSLEEPALLLRGFVSISLLRDQRDELLPQRVLAEAVDEELQPEKTGSPLAAEEPAQRAEDTSSGGG